MVPAVLAISGVSAHACSHHRGCRVGQCVQVSGRRTTPTCATGGPLGGASDYRSMLLPVVRIPVCCNQSPRPFCSLLFLLALSTACQLRPQLLDFLDSGQRGTALKFLKAARFAVETCCTDLRTQDGSSLRQRTYCMSLRP